MKVHKIVVWGKMLEQHWVWQVSLQNLNPHIQGYISTLLPSEGLMGETVKYDAVAVTSIEGEHLKLDNKVVTQVLVDGMLM